jgi:peptide/nickel transport system permease protein
MRTKLSERLSRPGLRLGRLTLGAWIAIAVLAVIVLAVLVAPLLTPYDPNMQSVAADKAPSAAHIFGLDSQGRDIFSRLLYGGRWSLAIGLGATVLALVAGAVVGAFAATSRRGVDETVMRVLDVIMAFPGIALAAVLVAVFGRDVFVLILAIGFLYMPSIARIVRANVQSQYGEDYVAAERIIGAKRFFVVTRHVAVNIAAPILVFSTVMVAEAIVFEASLSFIGAGVQPPNPSWGSVIADGKNLLLTGGWWATLFPGLVIFATVLCLNVLAEGLTDAIAAPSAKASKAAAQAVTAEAEDVDRGEHAVVEITGLRQAGERIRRRVKAIPDVAPVLSVDGLTISFADRHNGVNVVDGVSFDVRPGEVLGLIGESGCGKSLTSLAVMGLEPRGARVGGSIRFDSRELIGMRPRDRRALMGRGMSMIYQDALSSLNPAMTIKQQLTQLTRRGGHRTPAELLELVNLDPGRTL